MTPADRSAAPEGTAAAQPVSDATSGDLRRLIDAEARNDQLVSQAREAAAELIGRARDSIVQQHAALAAELERIVAEQATALAAERDHRMAELAAGAAREIAACDTVTDERVATAAKAVVDGLVRGDVS